MAPGSIGIACAAGFGSFIGLLVQAGIGSDQRVEVTRLVAAVDAGRLVNPGLVRQQIEGGLLHALVGATGAAPDIIAGMPRARALAALGLPTLKGVPSVEVVNQASFIVIFPITFIANTFVPLESLPGPLEVFAQWNPVSAITLAARELFGNDALTSPATVWPLQHPVIYTLIWSAVVLVVFIPLTTWQFRRAASR